MTADPALPSDAEAMIIPVGRLVDKDHADFEGSLERAREIVAGMTPQQRATVAVWTPGHVFAGDELLSENPGHEHDAAA